MKKKHLKSQGKAKKIIVQWERKNTQTLYLVGHQALTQYNGHIEKCQNLLYIFEIHIRLRLVSVTYDLLCHLSEASLWVFFPEAMPVSNHDWCRSLITNVFIVYS
jgi:hypothetical protein